jgi:hypothetical protein
MVACAGNRAVFLNATTSTQAGTWEKSTAIQLSGRILAAAWHSPDTLIVGTEVGIAVLWVAKASTEASLLAWLQPRQCREGQG